MDKLQFLTRVQRVFGGLSQFKFTDWSQFGDGLRPLDINGNPRWTGFLFYTTWGPVTMANTQTFGFLRDPRDSAVILMREIAMLRKDASVQSSLAVRNPTCGILGGAVRASADPELICAGTGAPELVTHLLVATLMEACELLSYADWTAVAAQGAPGMASACKTAEVSPDQYEALVGTTVALVRRSVN